MLSKVKVDKPPIYDDTAYKLIKWIFLIGYYLDTVGVTNSNMCAKFTVVLFKESTSMVVYFQSDSFWGHFYNLVK